MLNNNFINYIAAIMSRDVNIRTNIIDTNGSNNALTSSDPFLIYSGVKGITGAMTKNYHASGATSGICFGSGTTPATPSDYCIESKIDDADISIVCPSSPTISNANDKATIIAPYVVTAVSDITISEIAVYGYFNGSKQYIIDRTVLDTPIEIAAGETKTIEYRIQFMR